MKTKMQICEYGKAHNRSVNDPILGVVESITCNLPNVHRPVVRLVDTIDGQANLETILYRLETFTSRHIMSLEAKSEINRIYKELTAMLVKDEPVG